MTPQLTDEQLGVKLIQQHLAGVAGEKILGLRARNDALWPRLALAPAIGPADLHLAGDDYFAEQKTDGPGFNLVKILR